MTELEIAIGIANRVVADVSKYESISDDEFLARSLLKLHEALPTEVDRMALEWAVKTNIVDYPARSAIQRILATGHTKGSAPVKHEESETYQKTGGQPGHDGMAQAKNILCTCNWSTGYMRAEDAELLISLHVKHPDASKVDLLRDHYLQGVEINLDIALGRLRGTTSTSLTSLASVISVLVDAKAFLKKAGRLK